jgi:TetR/AcrR family transcriptional repressor of bet genes
VGRPSNTEERRQQIVAGLLRVMAERGYEGASVAAIAKAAELTPGLVHYHFKDKQEILLTLAEQLAARLHERVASRLARVKGGDARAKVDAEAIRQPEVRAIYEKVVRTDIAQLEELVAAVTGKRRAPAVAAGLFAAIQGYFVLAASVPGLVPPGSAASTVKRMAAGLLDTAQGSEAS